MDRSDILYKLNTLSRGLYKYRKEMDFLETTGIQTFMEHVPIEPIEPTHPTQPLCPFLPLEPKKPTMPNGILEPILPNDEIAPTFAEYKANETIKVDKHVSVLGSAIGCFFGFCGLSGLFSGLFEEGSVLTYLVYPLLVTASIYGIVYLSIILSRRQKEINKIREEWKEECERISEKNTNAQTKNSRYQQNLKLEYQNQMAQYQKEYQKYLEDTQKFPQEEAKYYEKKEEYDKEMKKYEADLKKYNKDLAAYKKEYNEEANKAIKVREQRIQETEDTFKAIVDNLGFDYPTSLYDDIDHIYDIINNCRADTIKEAINIFYDDLRKAKIYLHNLDKSERYCEDCMFKDFCKDADKKEKMCIDFKYDMF